MAYASVLCHKCRILDGYGCLLAQNDFAATSIAPTTKGTGESKDGSANGENVTREEQLALQRCRFIDELYAQPAHLRAHQNNLKQLKSIFRCSQLTAPSAPLFYVNISLEYRQRLTLVTKSRLCATLVCRLVCSQPLYNRTYPLRYAEAILAQTRVFRNRAPHLTTGFFLDYDAECGLVVPVALGAGMFEFMQDGVFSTTLPGSQASARNSVVFFDNVMHLLGSPSQWPASLQPFNEKDSDNSVCRNVFENTLTQPQSLYPICPEVARNLTQLKLPDSHICRAFRSLISCTMRHICFLPAPAVLADLPYEGDVLSRNADLLGGDIAIAIIWPFLEPVLRNPALHSWQHVESLIVILAHLISELHLQDTFQPVMYSLLLPNLHEIASLNPSCAVALLCLFSCDAVFKQLNARVLEPSAHQCASAIFSFIQSTFIPDMQHWQLQSTMALANLASHFPQHLAPHVLLLSSQASFDSAQSLTFTSSSIRGNFLEALYLIACELPVDVMVSSLVQISHPDLSELQKLLLQPAQLDDTKCDAACRHQSIQAFARLESFYNEMCTRVQDHDLKDSLCRQVFDASRSHVWHVLSGVMRRCAGDEEVAEGGGRVLKFWFKLCGTAAAPILPEICQLLNQCFREAGRSGSVFVWLSNTIMAQFSKLPEHALEVYDLHQSIVSSVYELLPSDSQAKELCCAMVLEVLDIESRCLRRFPQESNAATFQLSLQLALDSLSSCNSMILDGTLYFVTTCLLLPSLAHNLVQTYGIQILTAVLPRIIRIQHAPPSPPAAAYPVKFLERVASVLQRMFAVDSDGVSKMAMDIVRQWPSDSLPGLERRVRLIDDLKRHAAAEDCKSMVAAEHSSTSRLYFDYSEC